MRDNTKEKSSATLGLLNERTTSLTIEIQEIKPDVTATTASVTTEEEPA